MEVDESEINEARLRRDTTISTGALLMKWMLGKGGLLTVFVIYLKRERNVHPHTF